jgi:signal peptidase
MRTPSVRAVASGLVLLVLLALVAPFVVFAVPQAVGANHGFVVLSGSMEPYMSAGDVVIVDRVPPREIGRGDVITFRQGGNIPTTHRVIERVADADGVAFRTMGDANEDPDAGLVSPASVLGEVVLVIPLIGFVIQFANTTVGTIALVVVPIGLLLLSEAWRYVGTRRGPDPSAPRPAIRRVVTDADGTDTVVPPAPRATTAAGEPAYGVKTLDLGLTFVVLTVLAGYSGWMLSNELRVESAMVLAGAVMALLLVVATWLLAARTARAAERAAKRAAEAETEHSEPTTTDRPGGVSAPPSRPGPEPGQEPSDD